MAIPVRGGAENHVFRRDRLHGVTVVPRVELAHVVAVDDVNHRALASDDENMADAVPG